MNIPIFLSSDNNYAPLVATTMASILANTKSFIEFYVLDGGIFPGNVEKIKSLKTSFDNFSIEFIKIDYDKYFKDFNVRNHWTKAVYTRLLIPDIKPEIDRAIFMDVDVIVTGDINELFKVNLEGHTLAAAWEKWAEHGINLKHKIRMELSGTHKYFNAGVLLLDCKKWRNNNTLEKLFSIANKYKDRLDLQDQDMLNKCFDNNYKVLPEKYNYLTTNYYVYEKQSEYIIRHLTGNVRPWQLNPSTSSIVPNVADFWYYAKMTPFYDELLSKTMDTDKQKQLCRLAIIDKNIWRTQAKDSSYNRVEV